MWYNPTIYTSVVNLNDTQILFAMYQLQVAFFGLIIAIAIFFVIWKFLAWFLPSFWYKKRKEDE